MCSTIEKPFYNVNGGCTVGSSPGLHQGDSFGADRLAIARFATDHNLLILRARVQATTATHALTQGVVLFLLCDRLLWPAAHVVVIVKGNPALQFFKSPKQPVAVDAQVADHREFTHRLQFDSGRIVLQQTIDQRVDHPKS